MMLKKLIYILLLLVSANAFATHNRAGEITFRHVSGLTYEITIIIYTKESSPADRPNLEVFWGDGTSLDSIARTSTVSLGNDTKKNIYIDQHTYPGPNPSPYIISIEDPNRNGGIVNLSGSFSDQIIFYIQSELLINPFAGINNSPTLLNPPIDNACVGRVYVHNPGAVDVDGDSLYYTLQKSRGQGGLVIPSYSFPPASNFLTINNLTGDLIWDSPTLSGEFNVAILIEEFRNGTKIGSILRDMQITVFPNCPPPPIITGLNDTCVIAGDTLNFNITATGSSAITLSATGIPFLITNFANFQQITAPATTTSGHFYWETQCNHVRNNPYFASFKATDASSFGLVDFHTTTITIIGPSPKNFTANVQSNAIHLNWNKTKCVQVTGYKIYRHQGPSGWTPARCETGVPPYTGFQLIATTSSSNDTSFVDNNSGLGLISGMDYCYRVIAYYPNGAESKASEEVCAQLKKDVPIITNVSVNTTSLATGSMYLAWSKPTEHDTLQYPPPYRYLIYRGEKNSNSLILIDSTLSINDTTYVDTLLNTQDFQYYYRVDMYSVPLGLRDLVGQSTVATSVYLTLTPSDNQLTLSWNENTPWTNTQHVIYRLNTITLNYDSIDITSNAIYTDTGLVNLRSYCYKVKSIGGYSSPGFIDPILNFSQEACANPIDNIPPCPPTLCVESNCAKQYNLLHWQNQVTGCANDVLQFNIYRKPSLTGVYELITSIHNSLDSTFLHDNIPSIVGCYVITSIDSVGNESVYSDSACVDNPNGACEGNIGCVYDNEDIITKECFEYRLPNVFTPGKDGYNDLFVAFPYRFVDSFHIEIFNRWGQLMFETNNPDVLWDGTNSSTKQSCNDGTYYYVCTINEECLSGTTPRREKGFITLFKNK